MPIGISTSVNSVRSLKVKLKRQDIKHIQKSINGSGLKIFVGIACHVSLFGRQAYLFDRQARRDLKQLVYD